MVDCGLPLISPSGGWIGTVAHIVGAEQNGPRGADSMSPEDRRSFDNLILMCATHGREVDSPDTGERNFPVDKIRQMKIAHEAKVSEAVQHAIDEELSGEQPVARVIDTKLRRATVAATGEGLRESLNVDASTRDDLVEALADARSSLRRLSQPGLETLSQLLAVWVLHSHGGEGDEYDFGDPTGVSPTVPHAKVMNRVNYGLRSSFDLYTDELIRSDLLSVDDDEYERNFIFDSPWKFAERLGSSRYSYNFWVSAALFLQLGHGVAMHEWIRTLDFSIFDRPASSDRDVPWR